MNNLSVETCIKAISSSLVMGRKALVQELAVCIAITHGAQDGGADAKAMVVEVYAKGGYDCLTSTSRHYKTVNRRVNAAYALYSKLGHEVVEGWVGDASDGKILEAVVKGLSEHKFDSMDDVLEFTGKESNRTRSEVKKVVKRGKVKEPVEMHKFLVEKVRIELPVTMSAAGMLKLAAKIINIARAKEQAELKQTMGEGGHIRAGEAPVIH